MHVSDGVVSAPVLIASGALALAGVGIGLRKIKVEQIPQIALLASAFFVASLIHIPIGFSSVHLVLNGLLGVLLGLAAIPAIAIALFLQFILLQHGGLTSFGVNVVIMATPAVLAYCCFRYFPTKHIRVKAFFSGAIAVFFSAIFLGLSLALSGDEFLLAAKVAIVAHIPVMILEGIITVFCYSFLLKVKPKMLASYKLIFLLVMLGSSLPVMAHRVNVFAELVGETVRTESYYSRSRKVKEGAIEVYRTYDDKKILEGTTDQHGKFSFAIGEHKDEQLRIVLKAGSGHSAQWILGEARKPGEGPNATKVIVGLVMVWVIFGLVYLIKKRKCECSSSD